MTKKYNIKNDNYICGPNPVNAEKLCGHFNNIPVQDLFTNLREDVILIKILPFLIKQGMK